MERIKRQGLIVWLYTLKQVQNLKRLGYIHYTSERMKYVIMYVDESVSDRVIQQLKSLHYVRDVEKSPMDEIDMTFSHALDFGQEQQADDPSESSDFFEEIAKQIKETQVMD